MGTQTGQNARTLTGYVNSLLDYPRLMIERDVDFTHCHLNGLYAATDKQCTTCAFGTACRWLTVRIPPGSDNVPLDELLDALATALLYLQENHVDGHPRHCDCQTCLWLRNARTFLRARSR